MDTDETRIRRRAEIEEQSDLETSRFQLIEQLGLVAVVVLRIDFDFDGDAAVDD